jgi:hypothetical protein
MKPGPERIAAAAAVVEASAADVVAAAAAADATAGNPPFPRGAPGVRG